MRACACVRACMAGERQGQGGAHDPAPGAASDPPPENALSDAVSAARLCDEADAGVLQKSWLSSHSYPASTGVRGSDRDRSTERGRLRRAAAGSRRHS